MSINFISSKDLKEIMMGSETNYITEELFESLQKYQERLEELMRESEFVILQSSKNKFEKKWIISEDSIKATELI